MENIKPLDCLFFYGNELVSDLINLVQKKSIGKGEWSHVGIVVTRKILPSFIPENKMDTEDELYVWESTISSNSRLITSDPVLDSETGKPVFGVQIRKLKDIMLFTKSKIGHAKLIDNPLNKKEFENNIDYENRITNIKQKLNLLHISNRHKLYNINIFRLFAAAFTRKLLCFRSSCCIGKDWRFCSQFVAIVYKELNILPTTIDPEIVLPQDLASPNLSEENLPILFRDIIIIKQDN